MLPPFFTIITVCLNAIEAIGVTAESVAGQDYSQFEWIVIDAGSSDGTLEYLETLPSVTRLISEKDDGIYDAMNKGVKLATGKYCLFLNAGDYLYNNTVLRNVSPKIDADIIIGDLLVVGGENNQDQMTRYDAGYAKKDRLYKRTLPHTSAFIKKDLFDRIGLYDTSFEIVGDYDFFVRAYGAAAIINFVPVCVAVYHLDGVSSKSKGSKLLDDEISRIRRRHFSKLYRFKMESIRLIGMVVKFIPAAIKSFRNEN